VIAEGEAGQQHAVDQPLKLGRLAAPPHRESDNEMVAGGDGGADALKVGLPGLHDFVTVPQDRIEIEIAQGDALDFRIRRDLGVIMVEQMRDEAAIVGMPIENQNTHPPGSACLQSKPVISHPARNHVTLARKSAPPDRTRRGVG